MQVDKLTECYLWQEGSLNMIKWIPEGCRTSLLRVVIQEDQQLIKPYDKRWGQPGITDGLYS